MYTKIFQNEIHRFSLIAHFSLSSLSKTDSNLKCFHRYLLHFCRTTKRFYPKHITNEEHNKKCIVQETTKLAGCNIEFSQFTRGVQMLRKKRKHIFRKCFYFMSMVLLSAHSKGASWRLWWSQQIVIEPPGTDRPLLAEYKRKCKPVEVFE